MNIVMIMSGGVGKRFGANIPKQYANLKGKPIIDSVIDAVNMIMAIRDLNQLRMVLIILIVIIHVIK